MKSLRELLQKNGDFQNFKFPLISQDEIIESVKEWLTQKQQEYIKIAKEFDEQHAKEDYALTKLQQDVIDELLEELNK